MGSRVVVKVGTSSLTYGTGKLNLGKIEFLARELADLMNEGHEVALVTSGAQGAGVGRLGLASKPQGIPERQAVAAVGQGLLMQIYEKFFSEYGKVVAQVLLTREDLGQRGRYLNARNAVGSIFGFGAIPIINENDTVAVDEIRFGDNDTLSALVASLVDADLLIILSDIDGLYDSDPRSDPNARLIPEVCDITPEIEALAGSVGSRLGTGGMYTKIQAAKITSASGIPMVIANSDEPRVIRRIVRGEKLGTFFHPRDSKPLSRRRWAVFGRPIKGFLTVDDGAARAISDEGRSLLPGGITGVSEDFSAGDVVGILTGDGYELARGVSNYSKCDVERLLGVRSQRILEILGHYNGDEIVHRDNLICI